MPLARRRLQLLHDRAHLGITHAIEERSIECLVFDLGLAALSGVKSLKLSMITALFWYSCRPFTGN